MPDLGEVRNGQGLKGITEINFDQSAIYSVLTTDTFTNPHFFKKFEIIKAATTPIQRIRFLNSHINSIPKRDSGAGRIRFGIYESTDDITYNSHNENNTNNPAELALDGTVGRGFWPATVTHLAFAVHNDDGSTTGTIRQMAFNALMQLPPGYSIKVII